MTRQETIISIIRSANRPLFAKEIIEGIRICMPDFHEGNIRQQLMVACKKGFIVKVDIEGARSVYCKPEWTYKGKIKSKYKINPIWGDEITNHESKQIQVPKPKRGLGRVA